MKEIKIIALILSIFFFTSELKASVNLSKPLWKQVSELICKGDFRMDCVNGDCTKGDSTALWKIDFLNNSVIYMNMDFEEKINSKNHKFYDTINKVSNTIHFGTRMMAFEIDYLKNLKDGIPSVVLGATLNEEYMDINSTYFKCFPS
jgi:hypothetical protein